MDRRTRATDAAWKFLRPNAQPYDQAIFPAVEYIGRLTGNPQDPDEITKTLDEMLGSPVQRESYGRNAQRWVYDRFLVFTQVENWLRVLADVASKPKPPAFKR